MNPASAPSKFTVAILPLGDVSSREITLTCKALKDNFEINTLVLTRKEIPPEYFNAQNSRYQVQQLLTFVFLHLPASAQRIVGIVGGSLEYAEDTPCMGFGNFDTPVALYSGPHLSKPSANASEDWPYTDLASRHLVVHEFVHTLGLKHCANTDCVMNKTEYKMSLCMKCRRWADYELKVLPGSAKEYFYLAESWLTLGGFDQAITLYREAIRIAPHHEALYHHCLSTALYRLGKFDDGEQEMVLAVAYSNDSDGFNYNFGVRNLRDNLLSAEEYFAKALTVTENPQKMNKLIGQAYQEILHDAGRAARHYKEYLKLGGDDRDVKDWLESRGQIYLT